MVLLVDCGGRQPRLSGRELSIPAVVPRRPIGIFDSGFGGLTVARAVIDQLPYEDVVYLGDTARAPYGDQPIADVREFALECLDHLVEQGVKMLVIACNSASAAVLRDARERYAVPVVEVIMPAVRRAVAATRSGQVGVICTTATATSQAYDDAFTAAPHLDLLTQSPVPASSASSRPASRAARSCWPVPRTTSARYGPSRIDTLILGCTHYPLLTGVISYVLGDNVTLVSSADECAKDVYGALTRRGLAHDRPRTSDHRFWTTGHPEAFAGIGRRLMGADLIAGVEQFAATPRP